MAADLSRESPSALENGRARSWAAGSVYALGRVNFLSDDSREPHMTMSERCEKIGVSQSNASSKSKDIWYRLGLMQATQISARQVRWRRTCWYGPSG